MDKVVLSKREDGEDRKNLADVKWGDIASWTGTAAMVLLGTFVLALVVFIIVTLAELPLFLDVMLVGGGSLLWIAGVAGIIADALKESKEKREAEEKRFRKGY